MSRESAKDDKDAPKYMGMDRDIFNQFVRPYVTQIPIGRRGVGFDRLDLDGWLRDHKERNGIPATTSIVGRNSVNLLDGRRVSAPSLTLVKRGVMVESRMGECEWMRLKNDTT